MQLSASLRARRTQFEEELERLMDDEKACEQFAESANPLLKDIGLSMGQLIRPKGEIPI